MVTLRPSIFTDLKMPLEYPGSRSSYMSDTLHPDTDCEPVKAAHEAIRRVTANKGSLAACLKNLEGLLDHHGGRDAINSDSALLKKIVENPIYQAYAKQRGDFEKSVENARMPMQAYQQTISNMRDKNSLDQVADEHDEQFRNFRRAGKETGVLDEDGDMHGYAVDGETLVRQSKMTESFSKQMSAIMLAIGQMLSRLFGRKP